jgi:hypothetical protein
MLKQPVNETLVKLIASVLDSLGNRIRERVHESSIPPSLAVFTTVKLMFVI